jgi:hypothetical protein
MLNIGLYNSKSMQKLSRSVLICLLHDFDLIKSFTCLSLVCDYGFHRKGRFYAHQNKKKVNLYKIVTCLPKAKLDPLTRRTKPVYPSIMIMNMCAPTYFITEMMTVFITGLAVWYGGCREWWRVVQMA